MHTQISMTQTRMHTPDEDGSSSRWCSTMVEARMGSRGRVVACVIPMVRGEEEPRGAGLPVTGLVLPGKAALTYPDGGNRCDATQLPTHQPCIITESRSTCPRTQESATEVSQTLHTDFIILATTQGSYVMPVTY